MNITLIIAIVGMLCIGAFGFVGSRRTPKDLSEWAVAGRRFGALTTWFLQGGEVFTTFTFLGMTGLAFTAGSASFYALAYSIPGYMVLFFLAPRVWRVAKERGHLTQADFLQDQYGSRVLGVLSAVFAVVFLLPYLQLQITGLGKIVEIATADEASSTVSMLAGSLIIVTFVLWAGIRGVATTAYLKDALMILVMLTIIIVIPIQATGGISETFHTVAQQNEKMLFIQGGEYGPVWFLSNVAISVIGIAFLTFPHMWPAVLSAGSGQALRRNYAFMPLYDLLLSIPVILGFVALIALAPSVDGDTALLTLVSNTMPDWALGVIVVAGAATAMVPSAALLVGISSLLSRNVLRIHTVRGQLRVTQITVVVAAAAATGLAIGRPGLLASMLLLTFSGLAQLAPAIACGTITTRRLMHAPAAIAGLVTGVGTVALLEFSGLAVGNVNDGIVGLGVNLLVCGLVEAIWRIVPHPSQGSDDVDGHDRLSVPVNSAR